MTPSHIQTDAELYALLCAAKPEAERAFGELYRRHAGRVNAYCRRVLGTQEEASDVFQETFTRFYESAQTSESRAETRAETRAESRVETRAEQRTMTNVPAYLLMIARNLCLQHKRNTRTRTMLHLEDFHLPHTHAANSSHKQVEEAELLTLITTSLELLDFDHREAFVLREYEGFSYEEIADLLQSNEATIRTRVHRTKQKLRTILTPYLHDLDK